MTAPTSSERYLSQLCDRSFLRLWSWPHVYRDQRGGGDEGKEVCDLLAVFDRHVFIFSDKYCAFPDTGDPELDWARWFRRAVVKSSRQVLGAERWIRSHPDRLFLDPACSTPFPIELPEQSQAIYHRIVVAHGAGDRCRADMGGSGSLMLAPSETGPLLPFMVGAFFPSGQFVHVVDDFTLDIVLQTVDTAPDLAQYFERKEQFVQEGKLQFVAGEEDLLAYYLQRADEDGKHYFEVPESVDAVFIHEGHWERFSEGPDRKAQVDADRISYGWDGLIDEFAKHVLEDTQYFATQDSVSEQETGLRIMAAENRTRRRLLADSLLAVMDRGNTELRAARVVPPSRVGDPHYVFMSLQWPTDKSEEEYRSARRNLLQSYCLVVRSMFADAGVIIGIATEPGSSVKRSEDFVYLDGSVWSDALQAEADEIQSRLHLLEDTSETRYDVSEYPDWLDPKMLRGRHRNEPCPCGSGRKLKKCHGLRG